MKIYIFTYRNVSILRFSCTLFEYKFCLITLSCRIYFTFFTSIVKNLYTILVFVVQSIIYAMQMSVLQHSINNKKWCLSWKNFILFFKVKHPKILGEGWLNLMNIWTKIRLLFLYAKYQYNFFPSDFVMKYVHVFAGFLYQTFKSLVLNIKETFEIPFSHNVWQRDQDRKAKKEKDGHFHYYRTCWNSLCHSSLGETF